MREVSDFDPGVARRVGEEGRVSAPGFDSSWLFEEMVAGAAEGSVGAEGSASPRQASTLRVKCMASVRRTICAGNWKTQSWRRYLW